MALVWVNNVSALKDVSSTRELYIGHWIPTVEKHSPCKGNFYASEMTFQVVNQGRYMYLKMEKYYTKASTRICQRECIEFAFIVSEINIHISTGIYEYVYMYV